MNKILITSVIVTLVVISTALFSVSNRPGNTALTEINLRLPIPVADTAFAPYYLAIDKGIFAKHGLHVRLEPGTPELNPVKMVSQGIDQFGVVGGPELLFSARAKGAPLVGIALLHKDSNFVVILTPKESGITKVSDLQGKKLVSFMVTYLPTSFVCFLGRKVLMWRKLT